MKYMTLRIKPIKENVLMKYRLEVTILRIVSRFTDTTGKPIVPYYLRVTYSSPDAELSGLF